MDPRATTSTATGNNNQVCDTQHVYDIPPVFDPSIQSNGKVNTLKNILQFFLYFF